MDVNFTASELAFREEVRDFIAEALDPDMRREMRLSKNGHVSRDSQLEWLRRLARKGWSAPDWPAEHGGAEWTAAQHYIFNMETGLAGAPRSTNMGLKMCGPVLIAFGTEAQKARHLPAIRNIETWWCQGYSEPGAGSDLASLSMSARREGDVYVLNGSKTWTSYAHWADWMFCLVRTSREARLQQGISFLLVDMKSPGITVTPIRTIDDTIVGEHEINQVFFDNVEVPVENRVGGEGQGWTCAKYLLEFERGHFYSPSLFSMLNRIRAIAEAEGVADSHAFRRQFAELNIQAERLAIGEQRAYLGRVEGQSLGAAASMLKLESSLALQAATKLALEVAGVYAQQLVLDTFARPLSNEPPWVGPDYAINAAPLYFNQRKITILAGSSEIQRNIIARSFLGL